jgi:Ras-related protein Rab-11A
MIITAAYREVLRGTMSKKDKKNAGEGGDRILPSLAGRQFVYKLVVAGEGGVGKTTLIIRYCEGIFKHDTRTTVGVGFASKEVHLRGESIKLQIWDFGGEERFRFILPAYCKGANAAVLAFDSTRFQSVKNLPEWIEIIRKNAGGIPIVLVGTKVDLKDQRTVKPEDGEDFSKRNKLNGYFDVSSKTGLNVDSVFSRVAELAYDQARKSKE